MRQSVYRSKLAFCGPFPFPAPVCGADCAERDERVEREERATRAEEALDPETRLGMRMLLDPAVRFMGELVATVRI